MSTGFIRPFRRDQKTGFATGSGDELLESRLEAITAASGELPWKPELDSKVDRLRNQNNTPMREQFAQVYIQEAVATFEPSVTDVKVTADSEDTSLTLQVSGKRSGRPVSATVTL